MPMVAEDVPVTNLVTSREPKRGKSASDGSIGDQAVRDAVLMLAAAWALLFLLGFSLRGSNV